YDRGRGVSYTAADSRSHRGARAQEVTTDARSVARVDGAAAQAGAATALTIQPPLFRRRFLLRRRRRGGSGFRVRRLLRWRLLVDLLNDAEDAHPAFDGLVLNEIKAGRVPEDDPAAHF